mmetsp:Transcript_57170/g.133722  ORF Transcript_57170/g.133722 Transcript_57170/m.133722 type:complete len:209 (-) Transcript_57170:290-916(-)
MGLMKHQEASPLINAPQPFEVGPRENHDHPVTQLHELLDQLDGERHKFLIVLSNAALVNPETGLLPAACVVQVIRGQVLGRNAQLRSLDGFVVAFITHDLMPVLGWPPAVAHKAQGYLALIGGIRSSPALLLRIPEDHRMAGQRLQGPSLGFRTGAGAADALRPKVELFTLQLRLPEARVLTLVGAELVPVARYTSCWDCPLQHSGQF